MAQSETDIREEINGKLSLFKYFIATVFVSLVISLSCVAGYHYYFAPQIVAIDIKGYIKDQRDMFLAGKIDKAELKKSFDKLDTVVTGLPKNNVVLSRDAVIRNAKVIEVN